MYDINKLQGYIILHRAYSQYFIITINGVQPLKITNHHVVPQKLVSTIHQLTKKKKIVVFEDHLRVVYLAFQRGNLLLYQINHYIEIIFLSKGEITLIKS